MTTRSPQTPSDTDMEGLMEVLVRQYILHEVTHHPKVEPRPKKPVKVRTLAHDMRDIYKLLHQGTFGYWQYIPDPEHFREHLIDDYYQVHGEKRGPLLETVTIDNSILRINLGSYKSLFPGEEDKAFSMLERLVLESAAVEKGDPEELFAALSAFKELNNRAALIIDNRRFVIPPVGVAQFLAELKQFIEHYAILPFMSHSPGYRKLNHPSYVIADLAVLEQSPLADLLDHGIE